MKRLKLKFNRSISKVFVLVLSAYCSMAQPMDNPIASHYKGPEGYPIWTDQIKWNNVYNMQTFNYASCATCSNNEFEKFKYVRDIAYNAGGGILYYPGGTYTFDIPDGPNDEGLMLKKGVVIRGETPVTDSNAVTVKDINNMSVTDHGLKNLPTKFMFTTTDLGGKLNGDIPKMWNCIGIKAGANEKGLHQVSNIGICWVEINFGYVFFGFDASKWAPTWALGKGYFNNTVEPWKSQRIPNGTHAMDHFVGANRWDGDTLLNGDKRLVFGVHIKNGGVPNYVNNMRFPAATFTSEEGPWQFGSKIGVYGNDVLVANNVISKATAVFITKVICGAVDKVDPSRTFPVGTEVSVPYNYGNGICIDVNKNYIAGFVNRGQVDKPTGYYSTNVIIQDNWMYNNRHKGIDAAGNWMVIKNNVNRREYMGYTDVYNLGFNNTQIAVNSSNGKCWKPGSLGNDDFQARFQSLGGSNFWSDHNLWGGTGSSYDNSGEGIMVQDHLNGTEAYSFAATYNKCAKRSAIPGKASDIKVWNSYAVGLFVAYNEVPGTPAFYDFGAYGADVTFMKNINCETLADAGMGTGSKANVKDIEKIICPRALVVGKPSITGVDTAGFIKISWSDVANEAGYRVERRKRLTSNKWTVIAMRPRQETGGMVTFGPGVASNGFIQTSDGYPANLPASWDGKKRNMNPPVWLDFTGHIGEYEYRVVAIGCDSITDAPSGIWPLPTGLSENEVVSSQSLHIFPNPASGILNIAISESSSFQVRIYNSFGKMVVSQSENSAASQIDVSGLAKGVYFVEVSSNKFGVEKKKIVIE